MLPLCASVLAHFKLSITSNNFFNKSCKAHQLKKGYEIKSQNYAVIWSQMFISSQSKLSIESKKFFNKSCITQQPKKGYGIKSQIYTVIGHKSAYRHNLS